MIDWLSISRYCSRTDIGVLYMSKAIGIGRVGDTDKLARCHIVTFM